MNYWQLGIGILMLLLMGGCQGDANSNKKENTLEGTWVLVEGYRGGRKTESLTDTYFTFTDQMMLTNLPIPGGTEGPYTQKDNIITQTLKSGMTLDYTIRDIADNQLTLTVNLRGLDFIFILKRGEKIE